MIIFKIAPILLIVCLAGYSKAQTAEPVTRLPEPTPTPVPAPFTRAQLQMFKDWVEARHSGMQLEQVRKENGGDYSQANDLTPEQQRTAEELWYAGALATLGDMKNTNAANSRDPELTQSVGDFAASLLKLQISDWYRRHPNRF